MKIVLDTNIWLSAIFWDGEASRIIERAEKKGIQIIISEDILSEIIKVLNRESKFQKYILNLRLSIEDLLRTILSISNLIGTKTKLDIIKVDPKDNIILEAALEGKVEYIISYDNHLLNMIEFRNIKIISPREFLKF
ncbi:MAG: putative toxin-antitoxin system toxin component, PIN family [Candidatus Nanoarchaeia archaeon]|nr:putative toxin-antitoxin system toxin component, PIN family [Candidatus Nanoarchaeia archaeon]MDD5741750.1 putative toxin-antitoxin system toxin component, PIN family [Candidatus Nanoarchaeia archaeon]